MTPSRKVTSFSRAYEVAFAASGLAINWTALRPLKFVCAMLTFFPISRSGVCAATGEESSAHRPTIVPVRRGGVIDVWRRPPRPDYYGFAREPGSGGARL